MICCNNWFRVSTPESRAFEWVPNTVNQAANQRFVADSDPGFRLHRLTIRADSLANDSALAMIEINPL